MIPLSEDVQLVLTIGSTLLLSVVGYLMVRALSRFDKILDDFATLVQDHERRISRLEGFCHAQHGDSRFANAEGHHQ